LSQKLIFFQVRKIRYSSPSSTAASVVIPQTVEVTFVSNPENATDGDDDISSFEDEGFVEVDHEEELLPLPFQHQDEEVETEEEDDDLG
jgi:hypothetical protein